MSATDERGGSGETAKLTTAEIADVFAFTPQQAAEFEDGDLELQMETGNQYYERLERLQRAYSPGEILGLLDPIVETGGFDGADGGNAVSITSRTDMCLTLISQERSVITFGVNPDRQAILTMEHYQFLMGD